jgi:Cytochrome C oxidase, cbb3-type, subunit III
MGGVRAGHALTATVDHRRLREYDSVRSTGGQGRRITRGDQSGCGSVSRSGMHRLPHGGREGTAGPDLTHIGATLSRASMSETITHGNGQMPPFSTIKPADLSALLDYLQSLK